MPSRLSRAESRERTRRELVSAAIRLFARHGVAGSSVEAVAEEAGFSRGAYHSNFESRDELMAAVVSQVAGALQPELDAVLNDDSDAVTRLRGYIGRFADFCAQHPVETRALVAVVSHRTIARPDSYQRAVDSSLTDLVALFDHGQQAGTFRAFDSTMMAGLLRRALDAEALRIADGEPAAHVVAELTETFTRATRAHTPEG